MRVLCFDLTYLCNKDENRWNDEFFVSEDLIHRFPSVDEHTHGLGFDDWVTITCLNYQNLPEIEHQNAARHWSSSASQGLQFLLWRHRGARSRGGSRSVSLIASEKIASTTAGTEDIYLPHGIQIRWKFNFAVRVNATITRHLCCCSMCITLQRCDSQEMNCNMYMYMISHRILMIEQLYFVIADKVIIIYRYLGFICFYHLA